ncbi:MAG TPA: hypothetical protein PK322_13470 [Opitutaceae bacterium]|nr:hypothetical protein [Opitutaceae bacterium]
MADISEIYRQLTPAERGRHVPGQIFWIPAYEHMADYHVVRVSNRWDRHQPIDTATFEIQKKTISTIGAPSDLFHHMPIPELKLQMGEELLVKKVKRRPAVLVLRGAVDPRRLANSYAGCGAKPNPQSHVFAPIFSLRKEENVGHDYPAAFIEKVSAGELPEFIHLPAEGTTLRNESMAVLTQLQLHGENFVEETPLCLRSLYFATALETFWQDLEGQILNAEQPAS